MAPHVRLPVVLGLLVWLTTPGWADWPHLRGPGYDGVSTEAGLADTWPPEGPPRLWTRELGQGHSGFIVADGKVYTQRQTSSGQYLLCLDPDTGATLWEQRYDWAWQPRGAYPGPYASPTWAGGKVYYASPTGKVGCLDARTGASFWSLDLREKFQGKGWEFGYAATPLVEAGLVILPVGGASASLVALDAGDGHTVWASGTEPASYCPALPIRFQGRRCVVGYLQNALVIADLATGRRLFSQPISSTYDEHSAWPLYRESHLLLTSPFRLPAQCLRLEPGADGTIHGKLQWTSRELCNDVVSSILHGEHIYGFDLRQLQTSPHRPSRGTFKCLEWSTGKLCWSTDQVGQAAVLAADGKLLLLDDTGNLILARADPASYQELGRVALFEDEICWTPPTLWRGKLFVRSPSRAVCLYVGRSEELPATAPSAPPPRSWRIDATLLLSRERDYPNDAPSWEEMALWFGACVVLVFGGAGLLSMAGVLVTRRRWALFWGSAFCLGLLGPNVFSARFDRCLFTWPASLYAAFHLTLLACAWAEQKSTRRARWLARLAILGLLVVGWGFFELCKAVGMFIAWSFLFGLLPAFPLTYLAVAAQRKQRPGRCAVWTVLAFGAYFWSCQGLLLWKAGQGG